MELCHPLLIALLHETLSVAHMLEVARRRDQRKDRLEDGSDGRTGRQIVNIQQATHPQRIRDVHWL